MERGLSTEQLMSTMTRPRLFLYNYLKEKEKFNKALQAFKKGGVLPSQIILPPGVPRTK